VNAAGPVYDQRTRRPGTARADMAITSRMTLEEFLKLPETKPYSEFVNGEVVQKPMPTLDHGIVQSLLSLIIGAFLQTHSIGIGGSEVRCIIGPPGREVSRLPDYMVVLWERLRGHRGDGPFHGAPDLAVEVLSPDDRWVEGMAKVELYLAYGARLVWVIDPEARTVMVFDSPTASRILREDDTLDGGDVLPGFSVVVREILPPANLLAVEDAARP
jgi:Uma2 family endonuclease